MGTIKSQRRPRGQEQVKPRFHLRFSIRLDVLLIVEAVVTIIMPAAAVLTVAQFAVHFGGACV